MLKRVFIGLGLSSVLLFSMSASMVQEASKEKLGCIKGLGVKRVEALVAYRKSDKIDSLEELLKIKGIGKATLKNIKNDVHKKVCTNLNKAVKKKVARKKKDIKAE